MIINIKKTSITLTLLIYTIFSSYAQQIRVCGTHVASTNLMQRDTNYANNVLANARLAQSSNAAKRTQGGVLTIPVVIHVVYNNATQNISDAQILSQIDVLNQDYSLTNPNFATNTPVAFKSLAGNPQLQFQLVKREPNGKPTTGITRTTTSIAQFGIDDKVKSASTGGVDPWDPTKYLNIWICNLSALGYAYYPGGPTNIDGVVIAYNCFGTVGTILPPFQYGRTATHEIGHYFNLLHIWGDKSDCTGNDQIGDTPQHHDNNFGCKTYPYKVCSTTTADGEMYMNYMDYSNDICMTMFSQGQVNRMLSAIQNSRSSLTTQNKALSEYSNTNDAGIFNIISPKITQDICGSITPNVELTNLGSDTLKSVEIRTLINGSLLNTFNWSGKIPPLASINVILNSFSLSGSNNKLAFCTNIPNGNADQDTSNDTIKINTINIKSTSLPLFESFESTDFPPTNWSISNPDNNLTWEQSKTASYIGTKSLVFKNFNGNSNFNGQHDQFISPRFKCNKSTLSFYYAYKEYTNTLTDFDTLTVYISTDCGITKTPVFKKGGNDLVTSSPIFTTNSYTPANKSEWAKAVISLSQFNNQDVTLYFDNQTQFENNLYIDSIFVSQDTVLGIEENNVFSTLSIYPNPTENKIVVNIEGGYDGIICSNLIGDIMLIENQKESKQSIFDLTTLPKGIYLLGIKKAGYTHWEKIIKN